MSYWYCSGDARLWSSVSVYQVTISQSYVLPSFKWSLLPVDVMVGMYDSIPSNPVNFPPMWASLFYATRCKAGVAIANVLKSAEFWSECRRAKCFFFRSSKPNELIFWRNVLRWCLLKGSTQRVDPSPSFRMRRLWRLWPYEYDVIESRHVIDDGTNRRAVRHFPIGPYLTRTPKLLSVRDI